MKNKIYITNQQKKVDVTPAVRALLRRAVDRTLEYEEAGRACEISVTLVDNEKIRELNREHRGIDRPTDVLSFPIFDDDYDDEELCVLGDIVLSLEQAHIQAEEYGHSDEREIAFLCVHSMLHLLGYDHEEGKAAESEMFAKQEEILVSMGLTR